MESLVKGEGWDLKYSDPAERRPMSLGSRR